MVEWSESLSYRYNHVRYPVDKTLTGLFAQQVKLTPEHPAVIDFSLESSAIGQEVTYKELDHAANRLAYFLLQRGVSPRDMIAILVERSSEMLIGMLAILKTGCTYVPLNPKAPAARNHFIIEQCHVKLGLTLKRLEKIALETGLMQWVNIDDRDQYQDMPGTAPDMEYRPEDIAYVIFTSGSTGIPKGVPITHANLSPLLHWGYDHLGLKPGDASLQNLSYYFDWSVWEIFITLTTGGCLYMVTEGVLLNPVACLDFINQHQIRVLHITPTQFQYLLNVGRRLESMKFLCIGAEKLSFDLVKRSLELVPGNCRVFNMYGPTEATIISAVLEINRDDYLRFRELTSIPIGLPVGNTDLLVLDSEMNRVPVESEGELYIAGDGLSMGYLGDVEKTAQSFVPNCFKTEGVLGERLYKSGDRARMLRDGNIEFLGRIDHQVKIRGFRIEPGEIENQLLIHNKVRQAVVIDIVKGNDTFLCAYIVPASGVLSEKIKRDVLFEELKKELGKVLPDYMIPSYFVCLENIPLNPNGKLDRSALPHPDDSASTSIYTAPRDNVEKQLLHIWTDVLGEKEKAAGVIGIDHDFFWIGGHSLKGMVLLSRIFKIFHVHISLDELFTAPTVRELAEMIRSQTPGAYDVIPLVAEREFYPVSPQQQQLYILQQMVPANVAYNIPLLIELEELPDMNRLEQVFLQLIDRHESFRTSFGMVNGQTVQYIHQPSGMAFRLGHELVRDNRESLDINVLLYNYIKSFDLSCAPLVRATLIETSDKKGILFVDMHHIISDGMSVEIFQEELLGLYQGEELPGLRVRYRDYACWLGDAAQQEQLKGMEAFWLNVFPGEPPVLDLPLDKPRPAVLSFEGTTMTLGLGVEATRTLHQLSEAKGTTIYMVLLAVYSIMLSRLSNQEEVVIGTPAAGRRHPDLEKIIGIFINTLALRFEPSGEKRFADFLGEVKTLTLDAFANQEYPFEELVSRISATNNRDTGRNPLFDVMFVLQNMESDPRSFRERWELKIKPYEYRSITSKVDMSFIGHETNEELVIDLEYSTHLFEAETIQRFFDYFKRIIALVVEKPGQRIKEIEMIGPGEKEQILVRFNQLDESFPVNKTIKELFEEQVTRTPGQIALVSDNIQPGILLAGRKVPSLTYQELNDSANQLAWHLVECGVNHYSCVAVMVERSVEMLVAIIGILKTGAVYLPVNPKNPETRVKFILQDSGARWLLTRDDLINNKKELESILSIEIIDLWSATCYHGDACNPVSVQADSPAYMIYTSGSTGNPKGVLVSHANFCPLMYWGYQHIGLDGDDRAVQNLSYFFDWSVWEIFLALTSGASLYLTNEDTLLNPEAMAEFLNRFSITTLHITPTQFHSIIHNQQVRLNSLKYLCIGAEKFTYDLAVRSFEVVNDDCRVFNMYGPTEATIISAVLEISRPGVQSYKKLSSVPIGTTVGNNILLVLDSYMNLSPIGVKGELYIGGDGVARGYLNQPQLTAEKFIQHPSFFKAPVLYKTGDLARWLPDGNIEYLGRMDFQVKIRGYRIELGEIENRLMSHPDIHGAVVVAKEDQRGDRFLCAYLVEAEQGMNVENIALREWLAETLPDYMIPSFFIWLSQLPLAASGKINMRALPEPQRDGSGNLVYIAPGTRIEALLTEIWSRVLGIEKNLLSVTTNFFEIGGHSLKATVMISDIHKILDVQLTLRDIFKFPTIRGIANYIRGLVKEHFIPLELAEEKEYYPLSPSQQQVFIEQQMDFYSTHYNLPIAMVLEGELDIDRLENAFLDVVKRHECFRTVFILVDEVPVQKIFREKEITFTLQKYQGQGHEDSIQKWVEPKPFDLSLAPLFRAILITLEPQKYILAVDMHHIISDGVSYGIYTREINALYSGKPLATPAHCYRDYIEWQIKRAGQNQDSLIRLQSYWLDKYKDGVPKLILPYDIVQPMGKAFSGSIYRGLINRERKDLLNHIAREEDVTLFMILLALYYTLLAKWSNQDDIVIGVPVAGRPHADLEDIMGMFVNTLLLRHQPTGEKTFRGFLQELKTKTLDDFEHEDYLYENLVTRLNQTKSELEQQNRENLFNVLFTFHGLAEHSRDDLKIDIPGVTVSPFQYEHRVSKFALSLYTSEQPDGIDCLIEYSTQVFLPETIELLFERFCALLDHATTHMDTKIKDLDWQVEIESSLYRYADTDVVFDF